MAAEPDLKSQIAAKPGASRQIGTALAVVIVLLTAGYVHGRLTDRWGLPSQIEGAAKIVEQLPKDLAGWESHDFEISDQVRTIAGAEGAVSREYVHPALGERVQVMLLCGRPGPISLHPPTVCFTSQGWQARNAVQTEVFPPGRTDSETKLASVLFSRQGAESVHYLQTFWGWSADGRIWSAPSDPRVAYAGRPVLYKLYVVQAVSAKAAEQPVELSPAVQAFSLELMDWLANALPQAGSGAETQKL